MAEGKGRGEGDVVGEEEGLEERGVEGEVTTLVQEEDEGGVEEPGEAGHRVGGGHRGKLLHRHRGEEEEAGGGGEEEGGATLRHPALHHLLPTL